MRDFEQIISEARAAMIAAASSHYGISEEEIVRQIESMDDVEVEIPPYKVIYPPFDT